MGKTGARLPGELLAYWDCKDFGVLPDTGSYLDQDAALIFTMRWLGNIYETVQRVFSRQGEAIHNATAAEAALVNDLMEKGYLY